MRVGRDNESGDHGWHQDDIEIAREAKKKPIMEIGKKLGIPEHLLPYGHDKAKVSQFHQVVAGNKNGKLIW
jgi:formate--tetrahydrofolate ligase